MKINILNARFFRVAAVLLVLLFFTCVRENNPLSPTSKFSQESFWELAGSVIEEIVIPEVEIPDGGVQWEMTYYGDPEYFNDLGLKDESDIQFSRMVNLYQYVKRYIRVDGKAIPDDAGFTDRRYHSVIFQVYNMASSNKYLFSIPVDENDKFSGFLYFHEMGTNIVNAYRSTNIYLYPRGIGLGAATVEEGYATVGFIANVLEIVPQNNIYLLPALFVDNGNKKLRDYAVKLTSSYSDPSNKIKAIYDFLVKGDEQAPFYYMTNGTPGLPSYWYPESSGTTVASKFLESRKGVCNDFAELFAALTRSLNFDVKIVSGFSTNLSVEAGHAWNIIKLDNEWIKIDATWGNNVYWANNREGTNYQQFAQVYPSFDPVDFNDEHDVQFSVNLKTSYGMD